MSKKLSTKISKTKKISPLLQTKQNLAIYWNHKMSRSHVACNINDYIKDLTILCNKAPVTGRTMEGYKRHLFPDIDTKSQSKFLDFFKNKKYLDMGSGINHLFEKSLLYKLIKRKYSAMGMDLYKFPTPQKNFTTGTVFRTKLKNESLDIITSQYFLYYWLDEPEKLIKAFICYKLKLIPENNSIVWLPMWHI